MRLRWSGAITWWNVAGKSAVAMVRWVSRYISLGTRLSSVSTITPKSP